MSRRVPIIYITIAILLSCCTTQDKTAKELSICEELIWTNPDSVHVMLDAMKISPEEKRKHAMYSLLHYMSNRKETQKDTLLSPENVYEYYKERNVPAYVLKAGLQQVKFHLTAKKYKETARLLKELQPHTQTTRNLRDLSMYYSYMGYMNRMEGSYPLSLDYFQKAQEINEKEGYGNWYMDNVINMLNIPGYLPTGTDSGKLDSLLDVQTKMVCTADTGRQYKYYNNMGKAYEAAGNLKKAAKLYEKAVTLNRKKPSAAALNYARVMELTGNGRQADSMYLTVMKSADPYVLNRTYRQLYRKAINDRNHAKAEEYATIYMKTLDSIYTHRDRREVMEIQAKYDKSELMRRHTNNRYITLLVIFITMTVCGISYGLKRLDGYLTVLKLERYLKKLMMLSVKQKNRTVSHQKEKEELMDRIDELLKDRNRFRTIYRISSEYTGVTPEDVTAVNLYRLIRKSGYRYNPVKDRIALYHWVNLSEDNFVEYLTKTYPDLSAGDTDLCCFYRLGFDERHISDLLDVQMDTVRRHRNRLYRLLEVSNKEEFVQFIKK